MDKRLPSLDGWRAVAIILVLGNHLYNDPFCPPFVARWAFALFDGGLGVRFFFTISGFIITWLLLDECGRNGKVSLRDFYWRRGLRILPVYFSYLLLVLLMQCLGWLHESTSSWIGSLTFTRNLFGRGDSPTVHFWSLAIEEQYYLVWPLLLVAMRFHVRRKAFYFFSAIVVMGAILARSQGIGTSPQSFLERINGAHSAFRYADCIVIGCVAAFLNSPRLIPVSPVLTLCGYAGTLFIPAWNNILGMAFPALAQPVIPTIQAACFAVIMVDSMSSPGLVAKLLNQRILVRVGLLSYSLYVWHFIFAFQYGPPGVPPALLNRWYCWIFPALLAAELSARFIERPARSFKNSNPFRRKNSAVA